MFYIYYIKNLSTNKYYVGSTINPWHERVACHFNLLQKNKHHSKKLQDAYNDLSSYWKGELIESSEINSELKWIDYFNSFNDGYNMIYSGSDISEDTRLKMSLGSRERNSTLSRQQIQEIRKLFLLGHNGTEIASLLNIHIVATNKVITGTFWSWFEPEQHELVTKLRITYGGHLFSGNGTVYKPIVAPDNNIYINVKNTTTLLKYLGYEPEYNLRKGVSRVLAGAYPSYHKVWRQPTEKELNSLQILDLPTCLLKSISSPI